LLFLLNTARIAGKAAVCIAGKVAVCIAGKAAVCIAGKATNTILIVTGVRTYDL
jgi:hypothetical protein